ncbi:uncharacterized protein LOC111302560 [Durio zibethinus]|uniref:Uncharacterized protein LOC111302560 n=1 Tax=Durio zibethinus TaxID=66656 RepID=A0A6P5ZNM6_DURZI|nr:uncharacterized protein LOC111302560 [Durio zibethinus]
MDDMPPSEPVIDNNHVVESLWHHPNQLSGEMVLHMRDIFIFLADSSKLSSSEYLVSPASPHLRGPLGGGAYDPYGISCKVNWTCSLGTYKKQLKLLVKQLARVDPSQMSYNEKLAFWINLYNVLIIYGILARRRSQTSVSDHPHLDSKETISNYFDQILTARHDDMQAVYTGEGLSVSAADVECTVLKMNLATYRPQIAPVLALKKFKASDEQLKYTIDHPEPLLCFAFKFILSVSSLIKVLESTNFVENLVKTFRPENVNKLLKEWMKDCIQASVGVVEDSLLPDWICQFLLPQQPSMVRDCLSVNKCRLLGAQSFSVPPFDSRFRFLFLLDATSLPLHHKTTHPSKVLGKM